MYYICLLRKVNHPCTSCTKLSMMQPQVFSEWTVRRPMYIVSTPHINCVILKLPSAEYTILQCKDSRDSVKSWPADGVFPYKASCLPDRKCGEKTDKWQADGHIFNFFVDTVMWGHQKLMMPCVTTLGNNLVYGSGVGALTGRQTEPCSNISHTDVEKTETYILTRALLGWETKAYLF